MPFNMINMKGYHLKRQMVYILHIVMTSHQN